MASSLMPSGRLPAGGFLSSPDSRFRFYVYPDGNLVLAAYHLDGTKRELWASGTWQLSTSAFLFMNPSGRLELYDREGGSVKWWRPVQVPLPGGRLIPQLQPGSWLTVMDNGVVALYPPGGPGNPIWGEGGGLSDGELATMAAPGQLVIDLAPSGSRIAAPGNRVVINNTGEQIGVRDGVRYAAVVAGGALSIDSPTEVTIYSTIPLPHERGISSGDGTPPTKRYGPGENIINVAPGFSLR